ncbi:hypothetical protein LAZ67_10000064 [Cordylochernes scorpioides]|uniref:Histone-lysine N-methyltransferase SETMAR n=1 Tax=Cordylochernes scorpioides TaxID=51811 RepID=A0ABY6KWX0_9ARAC|nr:hypothetical protein LAZ67_10000064 [Cordylochernes scorpioides]
MPRLLTKEIKEKRLNACKELLERFLDIIVTGDESWIHQHIPDSKRSSAEWRHKGSSTPKKPRITLLEKKIIKPKIRSKRRGLLSKGVYLQHDNARTYVANLTIETINKLNFKNCGNNPPRVCSRTFYDPIWNDANCNAYNGSDGTVFPPHLTKEDDVYVFSQDVCRYCTITKSVDWIQVAGIHMFKDTSASKSFLLSRRFDKIFCLRH